MSEWWTDRQPRERALLLGVAALVCAFALAQFLLLPLIHYRAAAQAEHEAALAMLTEVEAGARAVHALRAAAGERPEGAGRTAVATTATELGLVITRLQPLETTELDVWLDDVDSKLLYAWVGRLQERGIPVTRASIQKSDGATVSAQITFAGGPSS